MENPTFSGNPFDLIAEVKFLLIKRDIFDATVGIQRSGESEIGEFHPAADLRGPCNP